MKLLLGALAFLISTQSAWSAPFCLYVCIRDKCFIAPECIGQPGNGSGGSAQTNYQDIERWIMLRTTSNPGNPGGTGSGGSGFSLAPGPWNVPADPFVGQAYYGSQNVDPITPDVRAHLKELENGLGKLAGLPPVELQWRKSYADYIGKLQKMTAPDPLAAGANPQDLPAKIPASVDAQILKEDLDPLWQASKHRDVVAGADEVAALTLKIAALRQTGLPESVERAKVLESELGRNFVDSNGLMKGLSAAPAPDVTLFTDRYSAEGGRVRANMNQLLALQQSLVMVCASAGCQELKGFQGRVAELEVAGVLADRLAFAGRGAAYEALMDHLDVTVRSLRGFVGGVFDGSLSLADALKQTLLEPEATVSALYHAVLEYRVTWKAIKLKAAEASDVILNGTPEQQGALIGKLTFDVFSTLAGGEIAKAVSEAHILMHGATYVAGMQNAGLITEVVSRAATAGALTAVAETAQAAGRISARSAQAFSRAVWRSANAGQFLNKAAKAGLYSEDALVRISERFIDVEGKMAKVPGKVQVIDETRAIDKIWKSKTGEIIENTKAQVFGPTDGMIESNLKANHRMTLQDEWAQYASTGDNALETVLAETDKTAAELIIDTRQVQYNKVLDLTDPNVRHDLGVTLEELTIADDKPLAYEVTHQIGFLAKKYGFDGILIPSTAMKVDKKIGTNIVRLIK